MEDTANIFRTKLPNQAEACARKILEWLQKDLQGSKKLMPEEVFHLASAAETLLLMRDTYGKE
jgi:hypothetical protein